MEKEKEMKMKKVRNLTPHPLVFVREGEVILTLQPETNDPNMLPRVEMHEDLVDSVVVNGVEIPVFETSTGNVVRLPEPEDGTLLVVSTMVATPLKGTRNDLRVPHRAVRDANGRIIGVEGLAKIRNEPFIQKDWPPIH